MAYTFHRKWALTHYTKSKLRATSVSKVQKRQLYNLLVGNEVITPVAYEPNIIQPPKIIFNRFVDVLQFSKENGIFCDEPPLIESVTGIHLL